MRPFSLLVKPAGPNCNLRCEYCFYLEKSRLYPADRKHRMSETVLERLISSYMATAQPQYSFGWQGGEPTLCGVDFFRKVTSLQQKYGRPGALVANGLQTNATLVDDELAAHLGKYRFLLGISLDGPTEIHDRFRHTAAGRGSHARVMEGLKTLARHHVEFNILTLVSSANVSRPLDVYRYLRDAGFAYHQYIPCVEFDDAGAPRPFAITGKAWGEFLCAVFDEWASADVGRVSVRLFDSILTYLVTAERNVCTMGDDCRQYFLVEHTGDVYPCDFFVEKDLRLGSVMEDSWEEMRRSALYAEFGARKGAMNAACGACDFVDLCMGDCVKHRLRTGADPTQLSHLCAGWKLFYSHALARLKVIAGDLKLRRALDGRSRPS